MKTQWVYDYETITNCFIAIFEKLDSDDREVFVVHKDLNQFDGFLKFLQQNIDNKDWHFGFNCIAFDAQITEYILKNAEEWSKLDGETCAHEIYKCAQKVISRTNAGEFPEYQEKDFSISVVDIFKLNHWDSPAKTTSLKWAQFSMDWHNVLEMPHPHDEPINTISELKKNIRYCVNDVESTKALFLKQNKKGEPEMINQIKLRSKLTTEYKINLLSASEPRISKEIFLQFLAKKLGVSKYDLKQLKTLRTGVKIKSVLLPYINFTTPEFQSVKRWFESLDVALNNEESLEAKEKKGPKFVLDYKDVETVYGLGGLHGCNKPGIYEADDEHYIVSADVKLLRRNPMNCWNPQFVVKQRGNQQPS